MDCGIKMKLENVKNIEGLFDVIRECNGRVDLVNVDMALNLKSEVARYFAMTEIFEDGRARNMELVIYDPEDRKKIEEYIEKENANEGRERKCIWIGKRNQSK